MPLYELVDKTEYPQRYQALYNYMHGKDMEETFEDNSTYDTGTVTEFDVPDFSENHAYDQTLIKDIKLGGQLVGQICEEYIPTINRDRRVIVVYPVIGTKVRYNMGFFIGDDTHKPARVAWNGTETNISEYSDLNFGSATKLYLRGASITTEPAEGADVREGSVSDEYLEGLCDDRIVGLNTGSNVVYHYPIVKIFDKNWTRMCYLQSISENRVRFCEITMDGNIVSSRFFMYYTNTNAGGQDFPKGWHVAKLADYQSMNDKLVANGFPLPGLALMTGGVTGFEQYFVGFFNDSANQWSDYIRPSEGPAEAILGTSDKKYVRYMLNGIVQYGDFVSNRYVIRLVKD